MAQYYIYPFGFYIYRIGKELYGIDIGQIKYLFEFILSSSIPCRTRKSFSKDNTVIHTDKVSIGTERERPALGTFKAKPALTDLDFSSRSLSIPKSSAAREILLKVPVSCNTPLICKVLILV